MTPHPASSFVGLSDAELPNQEVVLAASYDRYGTRLATASADHRIRMYDLDEKTGQWALTDVWRGHNGLCEDILFSPHQPPLLASLGSDFKLKLFSPDASQPPLSGRRYRAIYSQSPAHAPVGYSALGFATTTPHEHFLLLLTRDGFLSLLEPVEQGRGDDWKEVDGFFVGSEGAGMKGGVGGGSGGMGLGRERGGGGFKLAVQPSRGNIGLGGGDWERRSISVAVAVRDEVKLYRAFLTGPHGDGPLRFQSPAAVFREAKWGVRSVAWADGCCRQRELVASAAGDGVVRVYEVWGKRREGEEKRVGSGGGGGGGKVMGGIGAGLAQAGGRDGERGGGVEWKCVGEMRHEGVWKVEWVKDGGFLVSTGDEGRSKVWAQAQNGKWMEFADFGPDEDPRRPELEGLKNQGSG